MGGSQPHLINLIDSPGHVDFSSEVTAALRITDGAMVVVDCIEGCAVQTETVLRQSLAERVVPVLFVNKVDRCILELQMEPEDMYGRFRKAIEDVNGIVATYNDALMGDVQVAPEKGTVAFGSGLHGWGFNVERFAKIYAAKMGVDKDKMMKRLWGDTFFNAKKKTWTNLVVDQTTAVQYMNEIKEHVHSAFQWTTKEGPLCEENMRGIRFNLMDCTLHADSIHRGAGQIMPPTRRCCFAAEMTAQPTLQEPMFLVEITCPQDAMSGVYNCMQPRRGQVFEENPREGTPLIQVKAYLPVSESFGL